MEYNSVVDYIRKKDEKRNQKGIVIEFDGNQITRDEYWQRIEKYKEYFISQGFFYGCRKPVTICNLNAPEYELIYMALLELGAIVTTVSIAFFKSDVLRHSIEKGADTIILSAEYITPELKESLKFLNNNGKNNIKRIIFTSAGDYRTEGKRRTYNHNFNFKEMIDFLDLPKNIEIVYPSEIKELSESKIIKSTNSQNINLINEIATYSNTGGTTTGIPNCAVHTHEAIINLLKAHENEVFPEFPLKDGDKSLLLIPISHITSQFYALLLRRACGANIVYNPGAFEPSLITKALIEDEISDVIAPFGLYVALAHSKLNPGDLKNLKPSSGGEPTPKEPTKIVNEKLKAAGSKSIVIGSGSTELGSAIMTTYGVENRSNESGYLIPGVEAMIINPKTDKKAVDGERGILYARCPWQMKEYLDNEKATKEFFNYIDEDGKVWGTNNDIASVVGYYKEKPIYSIDGRVTDFVKKNPNTKKYYPGITFTNGKVDYIDLKEGYFLFDMRDKLLNTPGVIEAEALLIPYDKNSNLGTPVVNLVIVPQANPVDIIKSVYNSYTSDFIPEGLIFRTHFARSFATDKREILTLREERKTYYSLSKDGSIIKVEIPENSEPIYETISNLDEIKIVSPPEPKKILVKKRV